MALKNLGTNSFRLFGDTLKHFDNEATLLEEFAESLTTLSNETLDPFLDGAVQELQAAVVTDDAEWKQLLDASRFESRVEAFENARARVSSLDSSSKLNDAPPDDADSPLRKVKSMDNDDLETQPTGAAAPTRMGMAGKAFGNILAKGEAMREKLQENAMNTIQNIALNGPGGGQKVTKPEAIESYKSITEERIKHFESYDEQGWGDIKQILKAVVDGLIKISNERQEDEGADPITFDFLKEDIDVWIESSQKQILEARSKMVLESPEHEAGFSLKVVLVQSESIDILLKLKGDEDSIPELNVQPLDELTNEASDGQQPQLLASDSNDSEMPNKIIMNSMSMPLATKDQDQEENQAHSASFDDAEDKEGESKDGSPRRNEPTLIPKHVVTFKKHFWADKTVEPPSILLNLPCTFRLREKGSFLLPQVHGHLFTTSDTIYFLALDGKKLILPWTSVLSVEEEKGILGNKGTGLIVTHQREGNELSFVLSRIESIESTLQHFLSMMQSFQKKDTPSTTEISSPVPPDEILKKMEVVLSKTIKDVSITSIYDKVWSEGNKTSEEPFYRPWLEKEDCFDVDVFDWETNDSGGFVNSWCKETYSQQRMVNFKFNRTTHLYIGPPVAIVKQQQFCRIEGNDKCVIAMCVTFDGIPYSDTFAVEVRWVATRKGERDALIEVGLFVDFRKSTMLKRQIREGTLSETKNVHNRLFEAVRSACTGVELTEPEVEDEKREDKKTNPVVLAQFMALLSTLPHGKEVFIFVVFFILMRLSSFLFGGRNSDVQLLLSKVDELQNEVLYLKESINLIVSALEANKTITTEPSSWF